MKDYYLHQDDPVGDSFDLKYLLYPLLRHKHFAINTSSTFAVSRPEQFVPLSIRQLPHRYLVSWTKQRSTFLWDGVSTTSQTLPFRVFTLEFPPWNFSDACWMCRYSRSSLVPSVSLCTKNRQSRRGRAPDYMADPCPPPPHTHTHTNTHLRGSQAGDATDRNLESIANSADLDYAPFQYLTVRWHDYRILTRSILWVSRLRRQCAPFKFTWVFTVCQSTRFRFSGLQRAITVQ